MTAPKPCEQCHTTIYYLDGYTFEDANYTVWHDTSRCRDVLRAQLAERTRERDDTYAVVRPYMAHLQHCDIDMTDYCTCGLHGALEKLRGSHG